MTGSPGVTKPLEAEETLAQVASQTRAKRLGLLPSLLAGVGGLGLALAIERAGSFLSNVLAARWAGAEVFGAYSVALMAANNVAWYAGSGIGNTSTRFIAGLIPGIGAYQRIIRSLTIISLVSAAVAAVALCSEQRRWRKF